MFVDADDSTFQLKLFWAAVLRRAVFDYVLYRGVGNKKREWQYAYKFIFTDCEAHHEDEAFSFEDICNTMGWEPDYIRRLTLKMTRADIKKMETNSLKEVVSFQDKLSMAASNTERWSKTGGTVPTFAPYNYPPELRECFVSKPVYQVYERNMPSVAVRWALA